MTPPAGGDALDRIINELVTNALKHAFRDDMRNEIRISLSHVDEKTMELAVSDNGVGLPEERKAGNSSSMGLDLVEVLATKQLKGELKSETKPGQGTRHAVRFAAE